MTSIVIDTFGGLSPRTDPHKLPPHGATSTLDVRLHSGALRGWRKPASLATPVSVPLTTNKIYYDPGSSMWLRWDADVDIVPGPVADLAAARRYYYTGDGEPKKTDSALIVTGAGTEYPLSWLYMGVPNPTAAPTLANDGLGSGTAEEHVYLFTYVSVFSGIEEESGISPTVAEASWHPGDTITLTWTDTPPTTGYNITKRRIYRSNGSSYFYVGEQAIASSTFADALLNEALGDAITTFNFAPPPDDLQGIVSLPNGILAGFVGNNVYFSESYQPHAWPSDYAVTVTEQIVALVPVAQGCYALTEGIPEFITGVSPDSMTAERLAKYAPCKSKKSIATDGVGAMFASYNGVAYASGGDVKNITDQLFTQEEWGAYGPENMIGIFHDERYILWYR
jgi:hypothetical protein